MPDSDFEKLFGVLIAIAVFAAPALPELGPFFAALGELPPAFLVAGLMAVVVSWSDSNGLKEQS